MNTFYVRGIEPHSKNSRGDGQNPKTMADTSHKNTAEGLLDFLPLPALLVNSRRELVGANKEGRDLFRNLKIGEDLAFSTRSNEILEAVSELREGADQVEKDLVLSASGERSFQLTARTLTPNGDAKGLYLLVLTDTTHRREAEKIRSAFIANLSHELRSPLSTLIGAVETLKTSARDDIKGRDRFLSMMEEEAWRMKRLVDDLLSLSKVEAQEHIPPRGEIEIPKLLDQVVETMEKRLKERNMTIARKWPKALPKITAAADEIQEVFDNLIDNAIKYGRKGSEITLTASLEEKVRGLDGPAVCVAVHNLGEAIPPEQIPRLTERFYRVDKSRSRELGGTGLGLAIVKHIIKHHRGKLEIESREKTGTIFKVFLPAEKPGPLS